MQNVSRDWRIYNQQLVDRGRPSTYLRLAASCWKEDLLKMNHSKVGKPYLYTDILIVSGFAVKSVFKLGYREAAGNVADYLDSINIKEHPDFRTMQWRVSQMKKEGIKLMIYRRGGSNLDVIIDASGVKSGNDGEYRSTRYGKVKVWKEIHIAIDKKTRRILSIEITENDVRETEEFIPLLEPIVEMNDVGSATADGGYDSERNFEYCDDSGIEPVIPVHINSVNGRHKRKRIEEQLGIIRRRGRSRNIIPTKERRRRLQDRWKDSSGYHGRSLVEAAIAVFKGAFGEYTFSRRGDMKEKELLLKAVVYNRFLI